MNYWALSKRAGTAARLAEVVRVLVRHGFTDLLQRLGVYEGIPAKVLRPILPAPPPERLPHTWGERLRAVFTELGPTFVKLGQVLSTRADLVGKETSDALGSLQDHVDAVPFEEIRAELEQGLGRTVEECFVAFDPTPVAAGSISQVYKARLHDGTPVAVKVRRPNIETIVEADLRLLHSIADWISEHVHDLAWMDPPAVVEEFSRTIRREMDFTIEARVIERFRANYAESPHVIVPRAYAAFGSHTTLTMDWVDGVRVDALDEYPARCSDPKAVARIGGDTLCRQIFEFRLFHGDPHPGNILLTSDNRITFLDYGMVGHLEQRDVRTIATLLRALYREDAGDAASALLQFTISGDAERPDMLRHEVAEYMAFEAQAIMSSGQFGKAIERLVGILRRHGLQLAPRFSLLLKALMTIESTAHVLDPDLDMLPVMRPHIERIIARRFRPRRLLHEISARAETLLSVAGDFPQEFFQLVSLLRRGRLKIQLHHEKLDQLAAAADRASNRIAFGVITGSIIVGSSLLLAANVGLRWIGLTGYTLAGLLGLGLIVSILRSKNF
ncbi:MAG: putative protein kinase UbiB [Verrucomicrobia bacterium ADurb.Bin345]|nr:MAG: putative protein kinase UbiB [Verrucomicrobia bacterium ADurb.Bin345]